MKKDNIFSIPEQIGQSLHLGEKENQVIQHLAATILREQDIISIAPMLDWTDRHYRYFMRQITKHTTLYTEMVVADAIIYGNRDNLLGFDEAEHPLVLQLGGSDPEKLSTAAKVAVNYGYREINLNVGCPSERVQSGSFGACLMREPELVADCIKAMQDSVSVPVTIKHRIGLDYDYNYDYLTEFIEQISHTGCNKFIVHARNAVLKGLSPKENREIPPLRYDYIYQLKEDFPKLEIIINGGITNLNQIDQHLQKVDGVMIGREAYYNPYLFIDFDNRYHGQNNQAINRKEIATAMIPYLEAHLGKGGKLHHITRHMIGLYHGCAKAKLWRQTLTTKVIQSNNMEDYLKLIGFMDE